jgi:hypothetical protein
MRVRYDPELDEARAAFMNNSFLRIVGNAAARSMWFSRRMIRRTTETFNNPFA